MRKGRELRTLEELFGDLDKQFFRKVGGLAKPSPGLWNVVETQVSEEFDVGGKLHKLYVGDQATDVNFILSKPDVHGIIIPVHRKKEGVVDTIKTLDKHERIEVTTFKGFRDLLLDKIRELTTRKRDYVVIGVDLDDTLHPKFNEAQRLAAAEIGERLIGSGLGYSTAHSNFLEYFSNYFHHDASRKPIQGSDYKIALALMYLVEGHAPQNITDGYLETGIASSDSDKAHKKMLQEFNTERKLVNALRATQGYKDLDERLRLHHNYEDCALMIYEKGIKAYSPLFRRLEAEHSLNLVQAGTVTFKRSVYHALHEVKKNKKFYNVILRIITNKPEEVLKAIYDVKFRIA